MRNWLAVAAVILGVPTAPAFADRDHDPNSGAPLPPQRHETPSPITDHFYIRGTLYDRRCAPTSGSIGPSRG